MGSVSGVGVLDKSVAVLTAVAGGAGTLTELVGATGISRATAHRLLLALEVHRLLERGPGGRFVPGPRLGELQADDGLLARAPAVLAELRDATGESAQLYVRRGEVRVCLAAAERSSGLRDTVPVGSALPLTAGSAAQVLVAFGEGDGAFAARRLAEVRRRGWAQSVGEREAGVASVSAPVLAGGVVLAAVSVSGPIERLTRSPGRLHAAAVVEAAGQLSG